jgi:hypothetical protein
MQNNETMYEKNQKFNRVVSWLHSYRYKNIINVFESFLHDHGDNKIKVVDIGCAHAKLFSVLNDRFNVDYIGIEPYEVFAAAAEKRYQNKPNFIIIQDSVEKHIECLDNADVIVALETMEHITERKVVRIIEKISEIKPKIFVCSVPVEIGPAIWLKNIGSWMTGYLRHKEYTWSETFWAGLGQLDKLPPHEIGHKGFDWRWLAQTIRHNMEIVETRKFPLGFLPASFSTSVFFITIPRAK